MIDVSEGHYQSEGFTLDIDLHIPASEFCAVLGPSGAGKSTFLSLISGFENLQGGSIKLNGQAAAPSPAARPVSMVFQDHNVFAHLNVWANVALGIAPSLVLTEAQKHQVHSALERVGIAGLALRKPGEISGGERQRIALARVLVRKQPILLLDEPFAALDPGLRKDMLRLVMDLQRQHGLTVLMVTHQPDDALFATEKIIFVSKGKVHKPVFRTAFFSSQDADIRRYLGI